MTTQEPVREIAQRKSWIEEVQPDPTVKGAHERTCELCGLVSTPETPIYNHAIDRTQAAKGDNLIQVCVTHRSEMRKYLPGQGLMFEPPEWAKKRGLVPDLEGVAQSSQDNKLSGQMP